MSKQTRSNLDQSKNIDNSIDLTISNSSRDTIDYLLVSQMVDIGANDISTDRLLQSLINFFKQDEWSYHQVENESTLQISFQGENGQWNCYARARERQQQAIFYSMFPINAPENKRLAVAEFIIRANSGMMVGNFELDFDDGEILYKTSIDIEGDRLSFALIKNLVYTNVSMMDRYLLGLMSVIYGNVEAKYAIDLIEQS